MDKSIKLFNEKRCENGGKRTNWKISEGRTER